MIWKNFTIQDSQPPHNITFEEDSKLRGRNNRFYLYYALWFCFSHFPPWFLLLLFVLRFFSFFFFICQSKSRIWRSVVEKWFGNFLEFFVVYDWCESKYMVILYGFAVDCGGWYMIRPSKYGIWNLELLTRSVVLRSNVLCQLWCYNKNKIMIEKFRMIYSKVSKKQHSPNAIDKSISSLKEMTYKRRFQLSQMLSWVLTMINNIHASRRRSIRGMQVRSSFNI